MADAFDSRTVTKVLQVLERVRQWEVGSAAAVLELEQILQERQPPPAAEATLPPPETPASAPEPLQRPGAGVFRGWWVAIRRFGR